MHYVSKTSGAGQPIHHCRQEVLRFYRDRALSETTMTAVDFAEAVAVAYTDIVPEHARSLDLRPPEQAGDVGDYARALSSLDKRIHRYAESAVRFPAELEEAWVKALPEPYRHRCAAELTRRYGFMPVVAPEAEPMPDGCMMSAVLSEVGEMTRILALALDDGELTIGDFGGPTNVLNEIDDAAAAIASVRARVVDVLSSSSARSRGAC